eukprot:scpid35782/ scgid21062/ 
MKRQPSPGHDGGSDPAKKWRAAPGNPVAGNLGEMSQMTSQPMETNSRRQEPPTLSAASEEDLDVSEPSQQPTPTWDEDDLPPAVKGLRESLQAIYTNLRFVIEGGGGRGSRCLSMDEVYANLQVVNVVHTELSDGMRDAEKLGTAANMGQLAQSLADAGRQLQRIELAHILNARKPMRRGVHKETFRTIALSCAGGGKTLMFTKKAPFDWALGRIWPEMVLVFALKLRLPSVRQATGTAELLALESHDITSDEELQEIREFVRKHPEHVCLVLDGLDETQLADCSQYIKDVITGQRLPGIRLVITTRHSAEAVKLIQHPEIVFHNYLELLGFEQEDREQFVRNMLPEKIATSLLMNLSRNSHLAAIMRTPFFAKAMCELYSDTADLPDKYGGSILQSIIMAVAQQQQKELQDGQRHSNWDSVPDNTKSAVCNLGFFAFQMLIRKKVVFTEADFTTFCLSAEARALGLLVTCGTALAPDFALWSFSHLFLQESLAARFIANCTPDSADIAYLANSIGGFTGSLDKFWLLLSTELKSECVEVLIEAVLNPQSQPPGQDSRAQAASPEGIIVTHFLFITLGDVGNWAKHLSTILSLDHAERLAECLLGGRIGLSAAPRVVKATMTPMIEITSKGFLDALLLLWTRLVPCASTQMLYDALDSFAPGLAIRCFEITPESKVDPPPLRDPSAEPCTTYAGNRSEERRRRILYACCIFADHARCPGSKLSRIHSLEPTLHRYGLDFEDIHLTLSDCQAISIVLRHHHKSVSRVLLGGCGIGDCEYERLKAGLSLLRGLTVFQLHFNHLTDRSAAHIGDIIHTNASTLQRVSTMSNPVSSKGNALIHRSTPAVQQLEPTCPQQPVLHKRRTERTSSVLDTGCM